MRVYVIDTAVERMAHMARQLSRYEVSYERLAAVDGRTLHPAYVAKFRPMTASQVGLLLSHKLAWMRIAYGEQPYGIVLTDDIHVAANFAQFASAADWIPADTGVVTFDTDLHRTFVDRIPRGRWHGSALRRTSSFYSGTGAYLLSVDAARLLLRIHAEPIGPDDDDAIFPVEERWRHMLPAYQLDPAVCIREAMLRPSGDRPAPAVPRYPMPANRRAARRASRFFRWISGELAADASAGGVPPLFMGKIIPFAGN